MQFYSTRDRSIHVSLKEAVLNGLAPDGGLYMPATIASLEPDRFRTMKDVGLVETSYQLAEALFTDSLPGSDLEDIVTNSMNLDLVLRDLEPSLSVLETFHGPTMAFKDFGARFMARLMSYLIRGEDQELNILVATSGDTGSAVAAGFLDVPGINVIILYPSGKVSPSQEKQLTTQGGNITALEVDGNFDDCQLLVKTAFSDQDLRERMQLSSANSINIARLLPQSFYFAQAAVLKTNSQPVDIVIPSGNFGNLTACLIARRMGAPIGNVVAANNRNDVFLEFLSKGRFEARPSLPTLSNAMDVGAPSNVERINDLYGGDMNRLRSVLSAYSFDDDQTLEKIKEVYQHYAYTVDPHTAVGLLGHEKHASQQERGKNAIVVSTAHPAKFPESVEGAIGRPLAIPPQLAVYLDREKQAISMDVDYDRFKAFLLARN